MINKRNFISILNNQLPQLRRRVPGKMSYRRSLLIIKRKKAPKRSFKSKSFLKMMIQSPMTWETKVKI
jgi:hypothetical protein